MENVPELGNEHNRPLIERERSRLAAHGYVLRELVLDASMYGVPQRRKRLFLLAVPEGVGATWGDDPPEPVEDGDRTVKDAIGGLPEPMRYRRGICRGDETHHRNHWCMRPRSPRFFNGSLKAGQVSGRSFKTLRWDAPSITVAYGHREVHVHPGGKRRLSVFEGMRLQGFPETYELEGSLSSQIDQVSEAVPPPLAKAVAKWIKGRLAACRARSCMDGLESACGEPLLANQARGLFEVGPGLPASGEPTPPRSRHRRRPACLRDSGGTANCLLGRVVGRKRQAPSGRFARRA